MTVLWRPTLPLWWTVKITFILQCTLIDIIGFTWECIGTWHFPVTHIRTRTAHQEEALELLVVGRGTFQFNHSVWIGKSLDKYLPIILIHSQGMKGQPRWKVWTLLGQGVHINVSRCSLQVPAAVPAGSWDTPTGVVPFLFEILMPQESHCNPDLIQLV